MRSGRIAGELDSAAATEESVIGLAAGAALSSAALGS